MKPRTKKALRAFALAAGTLAVCGPAGCFTLGEGLDPPLQQFYYPTSLLVSPGQRALYVVNSDFDIQYTGGTVQAVDLEGLRMCTGRLAKRLAEGTPAEIACEEVGLLPLNDNSVLIPGPCRPIEVDDPVACGLSPAKDAPGEGVVEGPLIRSSRIIGAFASSATLARNPAPAAGDTPARLFVAVRGDPSITVVDLNDDDADPMTDPFRLDCATSAEDDRSIGGRCGRDARAGVNPYDSVRGLTLPVEPVGVAISDRGKAVVSVHQTTATATLLSNDWSPVSSPGAEVAVEFTLSGIPDGPADVIAVPTPRYAQLRESGTTFDYRPGFLVAYLAAPEVDLFRFYDDSDGTSRHFLQRVSGFTIGTNSDGSDSRGLAILDDDRKACEAACGDTAACEAPCKATHDACVTACGGDGACAVACGTDRDACLEGCWECPRACTDVPLQVFVTNRSPASLVVGEITTRLTETGGVATGLTDAVRLNDMVPLSAGPSRVAVGHVLDAGGKRVPRVFAVSFDSRYVAIYDPAQRRVEAVIRTGRGPHALAFDIREPTGDDPGHAYLYVAHFTDSYIGVVHLDARSPRTYGSMFAAVGSPTPPKESN